MCVDEGLSMTDYPIEEVLANIEKQAALGFLCFVKYTCDGCGARNTSDEPNTFCTKGYVCQSCQHLTVPQGINFLLIGASEESKARICRAMKEM